MRAAITVTSFRNFPFFRFYISFSHDISLSYIDKRVKIYAKSTCRLQNSNLKENNSAKLTFVNQYPNRNKVGIKNLPEEAPEK